MMAVSAIRLFAGQEDIRLDQLGYASYGPKTAAVIDPKTWYFTIRDPLGSTVYYSGELSQQLKWSTSAETLSVADFSDFTREGTYAVYVEGSGGSYPFTIGNTCYHDIARGLIRAFYYQRASTSLGAAYAGKWARAGGHPDDEVIIHPSAASDPSKPGARHAGEIYPSPKGWYDAGDYGKYTVNAGISTYELLLLYEAFPGYFGGFDLNIPESGNDLPDLLDEIKWELDWLLTMQDPADGGVYHKVTDKNFIGDVMPAQAAETRYFIGKAAPAAFDFAAVLSVAYRIYKKYRPAFADSCLAAAKYAWEWGSLYPDSTFRNPADVVTGEYRDGRPGDEQLWAGFELFIATGDSAYYTAGKAASTNFVLPGWPDVALLGCYSAALVANDSFAVGRILKLADELVGRIPSHPYRTTMLTGDYYWGSNGVAANQGAALLVAYLLTRDLQYLEGAIDAADYLFGRNATGYCFVTGFGTKSPMFPHHRPSTADRIAAPVPGLLVGGPNPGDRSGENCSATYPKQRAKSYLDNTCSFTTNEVAINWNAPAALLAGGLDAIFQSGTFDLSALPGRYNDTDAPQQMHLLVSPIGADRVTVTVTAPESLYASITVRCDGRERKVGVARSDSSVTVLDGLEPGALHRITVSLVDAAGNVATLDDSFTTVASPLAVASLYEEAAGALEAGMAYEWSFEAPQQAGAQLVYTRGAGGEGSTMVPFVRSGDVLAAAIPAAEIGPSGITCSVRLFADGDTIVTPPRALAMHGATLDCAQFAARFRYRLASVPGVVPPTPADVLFGSFLGDTKQWGYFGYDGTDRSYVLFDTVRTAGGGWLYSVRDAAFSATLDCFSPGSPVPVKLDKGWNCVGNPFTFPISWDNTQVEIGGVPVSITDAAAARHVRRQIFSYADSTPDKLNNGVFSTNRDLFTHAYSDSTVIEPWSACWVYAEQEGETCLLSPAPRSATAAAAKRQAATVDGWMYRLAARCSGQESLPLFFGRRTDAADGYDQQDVPRPPSPAEGPYAAFTRTDADGDTVLLMVDMEGMHTVENGVWTLVVSSLPGRPLELSWSASAVPEYPVTLVDEASGYTVPLSDGNGCTLPSVATAKRTITLTQGAASTTVHRYPQKWQFSVIAGADIRFSYEIPLGGAGTVMLAVYDIYGRELWRMCPSNGGPGRFTVRWNGKLAGGARIAQGYYIARLQAGSFARSVPLRMVR